METTELIEALRRFSSPTVANAIETFDLRSRCAGCSTQQVRSIFPEHGALVGFACTATIMSGSPPEKPRRVNRREYWEYLAAAPTPKVLVMQDLTEPPAGAYWGEVNTNIHRALGCAGLVTNGSVRDLEEVRPQCFPVFAGCITVSHAYAHLEDFGKPVKIGDLVVEPGDLIHADQHGFVLVPREIAHQVPDAAREVERKERIVINLCQSQDFSIEQLDKLVHPDY
jgi:regulator of RNase E activity RraA